MSDTRLMCNPRSYELAIRAAIRDYGWTREHAEAEVAKALIVYPSYEPDRPV